MEAGVRYLLGGDDDNGSQDRRRTEAVEGLVGLVRDLIRVQPGLERAIEASLAENVQALVFENLPSALAAIDLLTERQGGRAVLYPLDTIKPQPPLNLMRERGVVGVAARMVRVDNRFRNLIDALLGRTIIVETVQLGQSVLRRGLGNVVTLDGVLLRPNGCGDRRRLGGRRRGLHAPERARRAARRDRHAGIAQARRRQPPGARAREPEKRRSGPAGSRAPSPTRCAKSAAGPRRRCSTTAASLILLRSEARVFYATRERGETATRAPGASASPTSATALQAEARATEDR